MAEPGQPMGILKMYRRKNIQSFYERLKHLDYSEWPHIYAVKFYDDSTLIVEEMLNGSTLAELLERNRARGTVFSEEEAKTIHRLLESCYSENEDNMQFMRDEDNPLDCDIIIIPTIFSSSKNSLKVDFSLMKTNKKIALNVDKIIERI